MFVIVEELTLESKVSTIVVILPVDPDVVFLFLIVILFDTFDIGFSVPSSIHSSVDTF